MGAAYPHSAGWKARDTSRAAAEAMTPKVKSLRARVFDAIAERPSTPEEVAARIGEPVMNCRPRAAELSKLGKIVDSGLRRAAMGGRKAIVWMVAP